MKICQIRVLALTLLLQLVPKPSPFLLLHSRLISISPPRHLSHSSPSLHHHHCEPSPFTLSIRRYQCVEPSSHLDVASHSSQCVASLLHAQKLSGNLARRQQHRAQTAPPHIVRTFARLQHLSDLLFSPDHYGGPLTATVPCCPPRLVYLGLRF